MTGRVLMLLLAAQMLVACGASGVATPSAIPSATPIVATATPTVAPTPTAVASVRPSAGSFVVFCPAIRVRLLAPPRLMQEPGTCQGNSLFLIPNIADATTIEYLTVFRYAGDPRGATAGGWADILESFHQVDTTSGDTAWSAAPQPAARTLQGTPGFFGTFARTDKGGTRYSGALWTGEIGADTVAVLCQGGADQQARFDADVAQILATIELDAQ